MTITGYSSLDLQQSVAAASPHRRTQMVFEYATASLQKAQHACVAPESSKLVFSRIITQSMDAVLMLQHTLQRDAYPQLVDQLHALYDYILARLLQAQISRDPEHLDVALQCLLPLKSAWDTITPSAAP